MHRTTAVAIMLATGFTGAAGAGTPLSQLNFYRTGFDGSGAPRLIPAIDPAGICWHAPSGRLFITDSEIEEVPEAFAIVGANVFEVSPAGDVLYATYDLTRLGNNEPTGITYNEFDGFFYVSNDNNQRITRYSFSRGAGFAVDDFVNTFDTAGLDDPEGITSDPGSGRIYVVDGGAESIIVYDYIDGFVLVDVLDLNLINGAADTPDDPEGIAFDPCTGNLLLVTDPEERIYEFTTGGLFVARYEIGGFSPGVIAPQGLALGPSSSTGDDPAAWAIYIADGGIDNNNDPTERDGVIYEADAGCAGTANSPPVIDPIPDQVVDELTQLALGAEASDPDPGDALTFSLTGAVPAGAAINPATGLFTWTPSEGQGPGVYDLTVRVTDDGDPPLFDQTSFTVTVDEDNDAPSIDPISDRAIQEGMTLSLAATASDPDPGDMLTFSLMGTVPAGAAINPSTGLFTWTPSKGQGSAIYAITVRVTDDGVPQLFDETSFSVTVTEPGGNSSPSIDPIPDQAVDELMQLALTATASDPDPGDVLTFSLAGSVPAGAAIDPLTGQFSWTPSEAQGPGAYGITVRVTDDGFPPLADETSFTVTVNEDNAAPMIDPIRDRMVDELTQLSLVATAFDPDPGQAITFTLTGPVPAGAVIDAVSGLFTWTPSEIQGPAVYNLTVRVTDDGDPPLADSTSFTVTVNEDNHAPVIDPVGDPSVDEETELALVATAFDPDPRDSVTFSLTGTVPAGASIDPASGLLSWTPSEGQGPAGWQLTVRVTDDGVPPMFDETTFMVTVSEVNVPPVLDPIGDLTVTAGGLLTFTVNAVDPDTGVGPPGGIVAHWPFDTGFASTTGEHHGSPVNGASITGVQGDWVLGGGALSLDGANDHVSFGDIPLPGNLTVAAWILPLNIGNGGSSDAAVFGDQDNLDWIRLESGAVRIRFDQNATSLSASPAFVNGSWQHFLLVRSGGAVAVYRNGQMVGAGEQAAAFTPELLGRRPGDQYEGLLDDVAVWDRALGPVEIAHLYNGGTANPASDIDGPGGLVFSIEGDVPPGAAIEPVTGEFSWQAPQAPASWTFTVRVTDSGSPSLADLEQITVTVVTGCPWDLDSSGDVGIVDMLALLAAWDADPGGPPDFDGDGIVGVTDLLALLGGWGTCR